MERQVLKKYYRRIVREGVIKALMCGLTIGFSLLCIFATISWFDEGSDLFLWIGLGVFVAATALATWLFYKFKFRASVKKTAQRLDALGLEERLLTMVELEGDESFIAQKQREDAHRVLETVNTKLLKFAVSVSVCVGIGVSCLFGVGMTTVSAYSPVSGKQFFGLIAEGISPTYYQVDYNYEGRLTGKGTILTKATAEASETALPEATTETPEEESEEKLVLQWEVLAGNDSEQVVALPAKGWAFDRWSDGLTTPYRWDKNVSGNILVYAIFKEAKEDGLEDAETDDANLPRDISEDDHTWMDDPDSNGGESEHVDPDEEWISDANKIIDGDTFYGDTTFDAAYAEALARLAEGGELPDWVKQLIAEYYESIEK